MSEIRITSDPYSRETRYFHMNPASQEWEAVNNEFSGLMNEQFRCGRFAENAEVIAETICREFYIAGGSLHLYFEGCDPEFETLSAVCKERFADKIVLEKGERYLNAVDDILPV